MILSRMSKLRTIRALKQDKQDLEAREADLQNQLDYRDKYVEQLGQEKLNLERIRTDVRNTC